MAYDAFISYSHEADQRLAAALELALEGLARPWHKRRDLSIFRDAGNLNLSSHLWGSIQRALESSQFLLYLASPAAAGSPWVGRELEYWRANRSPENLIVVLTDGELKWDSKRGDFDDQGSTVIPTALHGIFPGEPFYLDMRWARTETGLSLANDRFKQQVVQIAAAIKGLAVEDVIGEEVEQHRRMIRVRNAAITGLATLSIAALAIAGFALNQRGAAIRSREDARAQARRAELSAGEAIASAQEAETRKVQAEAAEGRATKSAADASARAKEAGEQRVVAEHEAHSARLALAHLSTQEAARLISQERPFPAMAHLARALRSAPEDIAARSWVTAIVPTGRSWMSLKHEGAVKSAVFSPDGRRLVTASADKTARVWDAATGQPVGALLRHGGAVEAVAFSPDGRLVATGLADMARVWDARTGEPVGAVLQHKGPVLFVAFSPDGRLVVTGSSDSTARIWDLSTGEPSTPPLQHGSAVWEARFSPDGRQVITASYDRTARLGTLALAWPSESPFSTERWFSVRCSARTAGESLRRRTAAPGCGMQPPFSRSARGSQISANGEAPRRSARTAA